MNHGRPQPLQYVVNAAFLATLYSDYLEAADTPGWYCGPNFYSTEVLRDFAKTQVCDIVIPSAQQSRGLESAHMIIHYCRYMMANNTIFYCDVLAD